MREERHFDDFTESEYRSIIRGTKSIWKFCLYSDYSSETRICLWRHDLDISVHRALKLAQIEKEEGVVATYFIYLHSEFYNLFERGITEKLLEIIDLGHAIGLHFDASFYHPENDKYKSIVDHLRYERDVLAGLLQVNVQAFSFHDPDLTQIEGRQQDKIAGMINAYGQCFSENFTYISDSNGYWRYQSLRDVLEAGSARNIQVLTHPVWWVPEPMSPRARVARAIDGRANCQHTEYDQSLAEVGRKNIK